MKIEHEELNMIQLMNDTEVITVYKMKYYTVPYKSVVFKSEKHNGKWEKMKTLYLREGFYDVVSYFKKQGYQVSDVTL